MLTDLTRDSIASVLTLFQRALRPAPRTASRSAAALASIRAKIDDLDRTLLALLVERARLARRAGDAKARLGRGILDPAREQAILQERGAWAAANGLDPEGVVRIFEAVVHVSRRAQGWPG